MEPPARRGLVERVSRALALAGGCLILAFALLVTASVARRWLTIASIEGDFELVQMGLAAGRLRLPADLPAAPRQHHRRQLHLAGAAARAGRARWRSGRCSTRRSPGCIAVADGARRLETLRSGTTSMVLQLPVGWVMALAAGLAVWLVLAAALTVLRRVPARPRA